MLTIVLNLGVDFLTVIGRMVKKESKRTILSCATHHCKKPVRLAKSVQSNTLNEFVTSQPQHEVNKYKHSTVKVHESHHLNCAHIRVHDCYQNHQ